MIRAERSVEVQAAADRWRDSMGQTLLLTLTTRHRRTDPLATNLDLALRGWEALTKGRPWRRISDRLGLVGYVRSIEVTWGALNGWHPHVHALLLISGSPSPAEVAAIESEIFGLWDAVVQKRGARPLDRRHGVRLNASAVAEYVAKVQEHDRVGMEMTRLDLKSARAAGLMPFELLDESRHRARWLEYVDATHGRRAITWSRGLKDLLSIGERTDEEVMADVEASDLAWLLDSDVYDALRGHPERLAAVLEHAEDLGAMGRLA